MSTKKIAEFPDVEEKLQKPAKQSAFDRQRAEAEAKRKREAAETAAVYEDFVKSFDQAAEEDDRQNNRDGGHGQSRFSGDGTERRPGFGGPVGGTGKRHFGASSTMKSGPGSLGPPPASLGKKRYYDGTPSSHRDRGEGRGRLGGFDDHDSGRKTISKAFDASDDEEETAATGRAAEKAISKPTLRLANLPPTTSPNVIKALLPPNLTIDHIKIMPPPGPAGTERKSTTAIVTLSKETPASDIDAAVSALQNRYLGYGFYLTLHRHLSSAAISSTSMPTITSTTAVSYPFGAKRVTETVGNQPPQQIGYGRGFAPPTSYNSSGGPVDRGGILHVPIQPPKDIKKLRMIHKVIESVLEHGPEFEALLMSRPEVQREVKWAWLWDARSEGGIWYRWRLWEIVTGSQSGKGQGKYLPLFEGSHAWKVPDQPLAYEYTTAVDGFVSESEYNSSDEEDFDDDHQKPPDVTGGVSEEDMFLNPIAKSKLTHLLARLPTSLSKIRKGDIARVAAFAITHASKGSDEIVDMIVSNVEHPFAFTSANPTYSHNNKSSTTSRDASPAAAADETNTATPDTSAARLIALYVVSDILSSSSTSGVRHAWRYRQLFETALRERKTFELLGSLAAKQNWGRLRAEKWKRSVGLVLGLWEGWCVFPAETQEEFVRGFENPPSLQISAARQKEAMEEEEMRKKGNGKWKAVAEALPVSRKEEEEEGGDERMLEYGDTDGEVAYSFGTYSEDEEGEDWDIDGEPLGEVEQPVPVAPAPTQDETRPDGSTTTSEAKTSVAGFQLSAGKPGPPTRKRMRAVDMFAESGSEDGD
ncbi:hypothetical protein GE09DRAFT_1155508 [Coniochaeta sp. 2T2.1]|nr:hypothetical protein GE09DRAFT_1155508 [Coniochaeta sp. 2T2.1]